MLRFDVGKREHNRATQKLKILEVFIDKMSQSRLHDLNIEGICKEIGISKVTFFNYFKTKEEVVEYFIQLWNYQMAYEISEKKLHGREILYYFFERVSEHKSAMSIMTALTAFFSKVDCYEPTLVSEYELYLFHETAYLRGYRNKKLFDIFNDAIGEMVLSEDVHENLLRDVMSGFYGIPFVSGLGYGKDLKTSYRSYLDALLPKER